MTRSKRQSAPKFPPKKWAAGQGPRTEPPKKGKGSSYDRAREDRDTRGRVREGAE